MARLHIWQCVFGLFTFVNSILNSKIFRLEKQLCLAPYIIWLPRDICGLNFCSILRRWQVFGGQQILSQHQLRNLSWQPEHSYCNSHRGAHRSSLETTEVGSFWRWAHRARTIGMGIPVSDLAQDPLANSHHSVHLHQCWCRQDRLTHQWQRFLIGGCLTTSFSLHLCGVILVSSTSSTHTTGCCRVCSSYTTLYQLISECLWSIESLPMVQCIIVVIN